MEPSLVRGREAVFAAVHALASQASALILIGAQAIQEWALPVEASLGISPGSKDADLPIDARIVAAEPTLEASMERAGFRRASQPGTWISPHHVQVDLLVAESQARGHGRRSAGVGDHDPRSARRVPGLEACLVFKEIRRIASFTPGDRSVLEMLVARPAALLIAKLHKVGERLRDQARRAQAKDAFDVLRLLQAPGWDPLVDDLRIGRSDALCGSSVRQGVDYLRALFSTLGAAGCRLLREGYTGVGATLSAQVQVLASELSDRLARTP